MHKMCKGLKIKKLKTTPFIQEVSNSLIRQTSVTIIGLITSIMVARFWGPEGNGWFLSCQFLPNLAFMLTVAGFPPAITYALSAKNSKKEELIAWLRIRIPVIIISQWIVIFCYIFWFLENEVKNSNFIIASVMLLTIINTLKMFMLAILQAEKNIIRYNKCLAIESSLIFFLLIIFFLFKLPMTFSIFISFIVAAIFGFLPVAIEMKRNLNWSYQPKLEQRKILTYAFKSYPSSLLAFLNNRFSIVFITWAYSIEALGIFSIALSLTDKLLYMARSVCLSIFPRIAESKSKADLFTPLISSITFWITIIATILLMFIANPIITTLYGQEFSEAVVFVYIFAVAIPFFAVNRIIAQDFAGRGKPELNILTTVPALIINCILCFLLYHSLGLLAVVIAYTSSMLTNSILKIIIWCILTKQSPWSLFFINFKLMKSYLKK